MRVGRGGEKALGGREASPVRWAWGTWREILDPEFLLATEESLRGQKRRRKRKGFSQWKKGEQKGHLDQVKNKNVKKNNFSLIEVGSYGLFLPFGSSRAPAASLGNRTQVRHAHSIHTFVQTLVVRSLMSHPSTVLH